MIRKLHINTLQTNPKHPEEELQDTRNANRNANRKAASSLFPIKRIAKLERTHSNVQEKRNKQRTPQKKQQ